MAQEDVDRIYREIMALPDEEKLKFGEKFLELQRKNGQPTENLELWVERLKAQLERE